MHDTLKHSELSRRTVLATGALAAAGVRAQASTVLHVAAYPLVDEIARAALPLWRKLHPDVEVRDPRLTSRTPNVSPSEEWRDGYGWGS